jgi:hypothetical protein
VPWSFLNRMIYANISTFRPPRVSRLEAIIGCLMGAT